MKRIGVFIENGFINDVDVTGIKNGNPGIGGTEYLMFMLADMLTNSDNGLDITVFLEKNQKLPPEIKYKVCDSVENAIMDAEMLDCNYLILKHNADNITSGVLHTDSRLKLIVWCHVFICYWELDHYASNKDVERIVYVGREHLQLNMDHPSYRKSTYIYNFLDFKGCEEKVKNNPVSERKNTVTYLGSLVPFKGFHLLAEAWPSVVRDVPDAELYVIGSGKVYDSNATLGTLGVATKEYEAAFLPYLTKEGELMPNVHFFGQMGSEKENILLKTKVGVPNPTGITETFCLSAVEMQMFGVKIATIKAPGYLDTVRNGILYKKPCQLAESIVELLKSDDSGYEESMHYFRSEFSKDAVLRHWEDLLNGNFIPDRRIPNKGYRLKWLKIAVKDMRRILSKSVKMPNIERLIVFFERKIMHRHSFMDSNMTL